MAFLHRRLVATAVIAALAFPVLAQTPPTTPNAEAGASAPRGAPMQRHTPDPARMQERMARHMAAIKDKLQLTPAQEPAWAAFTSAMQPGERPARLDYQDMQTLTTPERIDRMRALRAQRSAEADRRGEAIKTFYATLTPAQQKTFDAHTLRQHRMDGLRGKHDGQGRGHRGMHGGPNHLSL